jgi:hypothetical protein
MLGNGRFGARLNYLRHLIVPMMQMRSLME